MRLAVIAALLGAATSLALASACSSSRTDPAPATEAGTDAAGDGEAIADAGGDTSQPLPFPLNQVCAPSSEADPCGKCAREKCCDSRTTILGTDAGNRIVDCFQVPGCDTKCEAACFADNADQTKPFLEHLACLTHHCMICGNDTPQPCLECVEEKCPRESLACNLSPDCFLYGSCVAACSKSESCIDTCKKQYPGGVAATDTVVVCTSSRCEKECN